MLTLFSATKLEMNLYISVDFKFFKIYEGETS